MQKTVILCCCFLCFGISTVFTQTTITRPFNISLFNNATLLPGAGELGVFGIPVHPGCRIGTAFVLREKEKSEWFQTVQLGYFYHQYVHHAIQLYTETGYRYGFAPRWDAEGLIGLGYLHAIPSTPSFKLKDGQYKKLSSLGRPQLMGGATLGLGYTLRPELRVFLQSQFYIQVPFVREYVPVLPNIAFHIGMSLPITIKNKS